MKSLAPVGVAAMALLAASVVFGQSYAWRNPDLPASPIPDAAVLPATVLQQPGRVYAVQDPFLAQAPGAGSSSTFTSPQTIPAPSYSSSGALLAYPPALSPSAVCPPVACPPAMGPCGPCPPIDPYGCAAPAVTYPAYPASTFLTDRVGSYYEGEGRFGDPPETLQSNLFLPFWRSPSQFFFFDVRGSWDDRHAAEGQFGVAYRQLLQSGWIWGVNGFYDLRHSQFNNNFQQAGAGFEVLNLDWEFRFNGYIPEGGSKPTGQNIASLDANGNIVVQQGLERAYYGWDSELGRLLWQFSANDGDVRGFIGGFYFNNNSAAFPDFGGPRARIESRLYDLPMLSAGSRLTFGATYQWDNIRHSQWIASANIRIPFGAGRAAGPKLSPLERRLMSPIRRDTDVVTRPGLGAPEQAVIDSTGVVATNVTEVAAGDDPVAKVAGGSDVVVITGDVSAADPIALNENQFVGGQFNVRGVNSGAPAIFGSKFTVNGTDATDPVFAIANNSTLTGLMITGGKQGVFGGGDDDGNNADGDPGVSGFTISNNAISGAASTAIRLDGVNHGIIADNTFTGGAATPNAVSIFTFASGQITNNQASGFTNDGFALNNVTGGEITGNTSTNNSGVDADGFQIDLLSGGTFANNVANHNLGAASDGFEISDMSGGVFSGNSAAGNADDNFDFLSTLSGGTVSNNTSTNAGDDGFAFNAVTDGVIRDNLSTGSGDDGFNIGISFTGGMFDDNRATNNTGEGYDVTGAGGTATATNNTGSGNAGGNTFTFP